MMRAILFDKDGTLFDFADTWEGWAENVLRQLSDNEEHAHQLGNAIGFDMAERKFRSDSVAIAGTVEELVQILIQQLPGLSVDDLTDALNSEAENTPQVEAVPLMPLLTRLRDQGFVLGLVTNDAERPARQHLSDAGILDCFDFIAGYDSGFGAKPAPGQLLAFVERMGIAAHDCLMVGDSTHDLIAGQRAGMRTVGVLTGAADTATLAPHAHAVLPNIGHLPEWLTDLPEAR